MGCFPVAAVTMDGLMYSAVFSGIKIVV